MATYSFKAIPWTLRKGRKVAQVGCARTWRMHLCPNRNSTDPIDSISFFQDQVSIKTFIQSISCDRNAKTGPRGHGSRKGLTIKLFRVCPNRYPESVSISQPARQFLCLLYSAATPQPSLFYELLTEGSYFQKPVPGHLAFTFTQGSFHFWSSITLMSMN